MRGPSRARLRPSRCAVTGAGRRSASATPSFTSRRSASSCTRSARGGSPSRCPPRRTPARSTRAGETRPPPPPRAGTSPGPPFGFPELVDSSGREAPMQSALSSMREAAGLVRDGDRVAYAGDMQLEPGALFHELLRQGRRGLRLVLAPSAGFVADLMISAGALAEAGIFFWSLL